MSADEQKENLPVVQTGETQLAGVDFGEFANDGFDGQTANDMAIPFLGVLQALSPQVTKGHDKYIEGAEVGDMINTVTGKLLPKTVFIVPCCTENVYVEWVPRDEGGGYVDSHPINAELVKVCRANAEKFNKIKTDEGHDLIETFYIYCLLLDAADAKSSVMPIVLACTGSKIKPYKSLMTELRTIKGKPPMYGFRLAVTTVHETNKKGQPYENVHFEPVNGDLMESVNMPGSEFEGLLKEGQSMTKAIRGGTAKAAVNTQAEGAVGASGDDDEPF